MICICAQCHTVWTLGGDKVSMLTYTHTHTNPRRLKWSYAITWMTAYFICGLMSDRVICKLRKSMVIHDTECPNWDQVPLKKKKKAHTVWWKCSPICVTLQQTTCIATPTVCTYRETCLWLYIGWNLLHFANWLKSYFLSEHTEKRIGKVKLFTHWASCCEMFYEYFLDEDLEIKAHSTMLIVWICWQLYLHLSHISSPKQNAAHITGRKSLMAVWLKQA